MGLRLLCAGCSKDERERVEATVGRALGKRTEAGSWTVSIVRMKDQWSVTIDSPASGIRALAFVAPDAELAETIVQRLEGPKEPKGPAPVPTGRAEASQRRDQQKCEKCHQAFVVIYESVPGEAEQTVPVACPHCWHLNYVLVGENAAGGKDYRSDKP